MIYKLKKKHYLIRNQLRKLDVINRGNYLFTEKLIHLYTNLKEIALVNFNHKT
jgi:hypothetical protein